MRASLKSINITPPVSMQMAGYSERDHGAEGIHDELYAKVLVMDDGRRKLVLVICDVIGIDQFVGNNVREIVAEKTDIKPEAVMISAIHTHSSVFACRLHGFDFLHTVQWDKESNEAYYQQLIQKIANGIIWADASLEEASIGFDTTVVEGLGTNRNDPAAYYDSSVSVLKLNDAEGQVMGVIVNHACHPTVLNQSNYLFSADYPYYFRRKVEAAYPNAVVAFSQGAAGSASTRYTKKAATFEEAQRLGELLADAALPVIDKIAVCADVVFDAACTDLILQVKEFPSEEVCRSEIERYEAVCSQLKEQHADAQEIRKAYVTLQGAQRAYQMRQNVKMAQVTTIMQLLDLGVCSIISIPGDVFSEIGRDIKGLASDKPIVIAGYTNDFVGYIVSKEGYAMDCYEKNMTIFDETSHDRILKAAQKLLK